MITDDREADPITEQPLGNPITQCPEEDTITEDRQVDPITEDPVGTQSLRA